MHSFHICTLQINIISKANNVTSLYQSAVIMCYKCILGNLEISILVKENK